jgi:hypothetical protein
MFLSVQRIGSQRRAATRVSDRPHDEPKSGEYDAAFELCIQPKARGMIAKTITARDASRAAMFAFIARYRSP